MPLWQAMARMTMQQDLFFRVATAAAITLTISLTGCLEINQTLVLNKDGSGIVRLVYGYSEERAEHMQALYNAMYIESDDESATETTFDLTDDEIRRDFKSYEPYGVKLRSIKNSTRDGWRYRTLDIAFESLNGLSKIDFLAERKVSLVKDAQGNYVLTQSGSNSRNTVGTESSFPEIPTDPISARLMAGFRAVLHIRAPSEILRTNAPQKKERVATWVFDIDEDPDALEKMQATTMTVVFDGKGLQIPEFKSAGALGKR